MSRKRKGEVNQRSNEGEVWEIQEEEFYEEVFATPLSEAGPEPALAVDSEDQLPNHGGHSIYLSQNNNNYIYSLQNNKELKDEWNLLKQETPSLLPLPETTSNYFNPKEDFLCKHCNGIFKRTERFRLKRLLCQECGSAERRRTATAAYYKRKNPIGRPKKKKPTGRKRKQGRPPKDLARYRRYKKNLRKKEALLLKGVFPEGLETVKIKNPRKKVWIEVDCIEENSEIVKILFGRGWRIGGSTIWPKIPPEDALAIIEPDYTYTPYRPTVAYPKKKHFPDGKTV